MANATRNAVPPPSDVGRSVARMAHREGKELTSAVAPPLREAPSQSYEEELAALQEYWNRRAKEHGILSEDHLCRYLSA